MTAAGASVLDLARGGNFNPFGQSLMSFLLRHRIFPYKMTINTKNKRSNLHYLHPLVNYKSWVIGQKFGCGDWLGCGRFQDGFW
jgi:hypothetical protein